MSYLKINDLKNCFPELPGVSGARLNFARVGLIVGLLCWVMAIAVGCGDSAFGTSRPMPAPLRDDFPYEVSGLRAGYFYGDSFQITNADHLHCVVIEGIDTPKPGQAFNREARRAILDLINKQTMRMEVTRRDSHQREIAVVYVPGSDPAQESLEPLDEDRFPAEVPEVDVGFEMIRQGLGWYDGNEFPQAEKYRFAEEEARAAKRGLWADEDPIPPWDYEKSKRN